MQLEEKSVGEVLVVKPLDPRIDASSAIDFREKMVKWINSGHKHIVLDLSAVDFVDSSGLGAIVSVLKVLGDTGDLVICGLKETVMQLFRITRMHRVFRIFPSEETAVKALAG